MKILQVNNVYNSGSTGKIVRDMHVVLQQKGYDSIVCASRTKNDKKQHIYTICPSWYAKAMHLFSWFTGQMYGGAFLATLRLIRIIRKEQPDVVHLQCINGYFVNIFLLVNYLKRHHIRTVLTLHAEFMHTANCGYALDCERWKTGCGKCPRLRKETGSLFLDGTARSWQRMRQAFNGFDDHLIVTSVSPWLMERAKQSPILAGKKHVVVLNGLDTNIFRYSPANDLRQALGISPIEKVVFHASPSFNDNPNHIKGGYYVIELAKRMPDVRFVIAGSYPEGLRVPSNMLLLGKVTNQSYLAQLYSMADLTVLASQKETFSMICAETLCCGTPIVGFKAGAPEQISLPDYSRFVEYGDVDALQTAVTQFLQKQWSKEDIAQCARKVYAKDVMADNYIQVYNEILKK